MSRWKHRLLALTGVGLLSVGASSLAGSSAAPKPKPPTTSQSNGQANGHEDFVVSGHVEELRPGGTRPMVLTVRNPNSVAIRVTSLTVTAGSAPGCPASTLTLPQWTGSLLVPKKNGTATLTVNVHLKPSAPDACQGARWPLTYGGRAVKA